MRDVPRRARSKLSSACKSSTVLAAKLPLHKALRQCLVILKSGEDVRLSQQRSRETLDNLLPNGDVA